MKIAYVYDLIYPYEIGGAQKRIWELARRLAQRGHDVTLFGMKYWEGEDIIYKEGVRLWGVCTPQALFDGGRRSIKEALYFAAKIFPVLIKERFDIVDCCEMPYLHCFPAKICSLVNGYPLVITWHEVWDDYWFAYLGKYKGRIGKFIESMTRRLPDHIFAISQKVRDDLIRLNVDPDKIDITYRGTDFIDVKLSRIREIKFASDVVYAGRLNEHKNIDILIKAIQLVSKKVPSVKCVIIGDGPERSTLENLVKALNLNTNVTFLGFLESQGDVFNYFMNSKVFVFPSTREGFGSGIIEANACGLPVIGISDKNNANTELIIEGKSGFLVNLSAKEISDKIILLLEDDDHQKNMSDYSIKQSYKYDWTTIMAEIEKKYIEMACRAKQVRHL